LELKSALLSHQRETVVATRDAGNLSSAELLESVLQFLRTYYPELSLDVDPRDHPIVAASRLVQEDLCVLLRDDVWRLQAACVCFPSRWRLAEKIGNSLGDIHAPVPLYDEILANPTNAFFDRLTPERSFWRLNWTLLDRPELHQPAGGKSRTCANSDEWYFRVERQTLRQLARTRAVVFTIRTYVAPLREMIESDSQFGENLVRAIEESPPAIHEYKGWRGIGDRLQAALEKEP
jgi:hypothetical protein